MKIIKWLFLPITWAVGFLMPLFAQSILALQLTESIPAAYAAGAVIALSWGAMAQVRGSWIWLK